MRLVYQTLGNHSPAPFHRTVVLANSYIPFYATFTSKVIDGIEYYDRPCFTKNMIKKSNTLKNIKDSLEMAASVRRIPIGGKFYFFMKGAMYTEDGTPMMVLAMPQKAYRDPTVKRFSDFGNGRTINVDYKNFVLFYSTSFFIDPNLAPLNRRFQKEILMSCYEKGIEVRVITSSEIERNTFARLFEIPKAKSISQLEEYMSRVLPNFLHTEEEDSFVFGELAVPQTQNEELSIEEEALLFDTQEESLLPGVNPQSFQLTFSSEYAVEREEMEREAATWDDFAHTESPYLVVMDPISDEVTITERRPHPVNSLVERMSSVQDFYTRQIHEAQRVGSRDNRPIELIDDEA